TTDARVLPVDGTVRRAIKLDQAEEGEQDAVNRRRDAEPAQTAGRHEVVPYRDKDDEQGQPPQQIHPCPLRIDTDAVPGRSEALISCISPKLRVTRREE